ncbi:MAG: TolC family protein, partial [Thermodesulfobacteriota bacterium]|nr:TolC family protein [Thermodesulfobacteriota bacterium]
LERNRQRLVSRADVEIAEAQYRQALSVYWPHLTLRMKATRMDEDPNISIPESTSTYTISGLGPAPASAVVTVPETRGRLMDRDSLANSLDLTYPVFTGGKRSAISEQARIGVDAAKESARRTDLQVIYDVKRMYYGAVLAKSLKGLGQETLDRFQVTLELTERFLKSGTGIIKKTDYLRTKVIVSMIRSTMALLKSNEQMAKAALANTMGLEWNVQVNPASTEIPFEPLGANLANLVSDAYEFNPDWSKLKLGLKAAEARIKEAKSGYFSVVSLIGSLNRLDNSNEIGIMTDENRKSWTIGIAMEFPLFTGFRTRNQVKEAMARLEKRARKRSFSMKDLPALQVKDTFLQTTRAQGQVLATRDSFDAARKNKELNVRAYRNELVEQRTSLKRSFWNHLSMPST